MANAIQSGVVVTEVPNPALNVPPGQQNITAIVGGGSPTIVVANIQITKGATNGTDVIPGTISGSVQSIIGVGVAPGYFNFILGTDYIQTDNTIVWQNGGNQPPTGAFYWANINKNKDASFYQPLTFFDIDDVRSTYGPELQNGIQNDITLAASLVFTAGGDGTIVIGCQIVDGSTTSYFSAIDKLQTVELDTLVVTGITNSSVLAYTIQHVELMSSDSIGMERHAYAAPMNLNDVPATIGALAQSIDSDRITLTTPPSMGVTVLDVGTNQDVRLAISSIYGGGASLAGLEAANDVATPLLRKVLPGNVDTNGFAYINSEVIYFISQGVTIIDQNASGAFVRESSTTNVSSIETVEPSIRRIKDVVRKTVRTTLNNRYIGNKLLQGSISNVASSVQAILTNFINATIITGFQNITAKQDSVDPRKIDISFQIAPVFPLRFIQVTFSIFVNTNLG
jgi:tail sheath protein